MRRAFTLHTKTLRHFSSNLKPNQCTLISDNLKSNNNIIGPPKPLSSSPFTSNLRSFSSNDSSNQNTDSKSEPTEPKSEPTGPESEPIESKSEPTESKSEPEDPLTGIEDVSNEVLKKQLDEYLKKGNREILPTIFESFLKRSLFQKHVETDDELLEELKSKAPVLSDLSDDEYEDALEEMAESEDEIYNMCDAKEIVIKRMKADPYFNMNLRKYDSMVQEAVERGEMEEPKEYEDFLEDILRGNNRLPDHANQKIENKTNEIEDMIDRGELTPEEGQALIDEFEEKLINQLMDEEKAAQQFDKPDKKKEQDNGPPGEGPILRWQSRVVFVPGDDAWHPKNRKVKMAVTVKELGLSKHQSRRLRELVGKRYNSGKDELTLTSERFEHREENRKDCLRTLYALVDEARKADELVDNAHVSYVKERLKENPEFMEKLRAKVLRTRESNMISA